MRPGNLRNPSKLVDQTQKDANQHNDAFRILAVIIARDMMKKRTEMKDINSLEKDKK